MSGNTDWVARFELKQLTHEQIANIWKAAKLGDIDALDDPESRQIGNLMLQHMDEFGEEFDRLPDIDFSDSEVNPLLHIITHAIVQNQIEQKNPIETYQFYMSMQQKGVTDHEAVHLVAKILSSLMFDMFQTHVFDQKRYERLLKKFKRKNKDIIYDAIDKEFDNRYA